MAADNERKRRFVLHNYEQQLMTARRLARYKVRMRLAEGLEPDDPDPSYRRQAFSSQISQELYDSLLFYPGSNPVIEDIRQELSEELGQQIEFTYPPGGTLRMAVRGPEGLRHLSQEEQAVARLILRRLTSKNVEKKLIHNLPGINTQV